MRLGFITIYYYYIELLIHNDCIYQIAFLIYLRYEKIGNVKHSHDLHLYNQPFLLLLGDKSLNTTLPEATACELHLYSKYVGNRPQLTEIFKH